MATEKTIEAPATEAPATKESTLDVDLTQKTPATQEPTLKEMPLEPLESEKVTPNASEDTSSRTTATLATKLVLVCLLVGCLWCFLFGLGLMGDSFKVLGGKSAGKLFSSIENPLAGLMVGILATVLVQSSSTSTSIVVGLVGSGIMDVPTAIPIIMGANIGTSVTNTIVSMGHINNKEEYQRAFAGATVHDMFNFLTVFVMLPLEVIIGAMTGHAGEGMLYWISDAMTSALESEAGGEFESPIKKLVSPATKKLLSIDKNKIKALSYGKPEIDTCIDKVVASVDFEVCGNQTKLDAALTAWDDNVISGSLIKAGHFEGEDDVFAGIMCLVISLLVLCIALYAIVKILKKLILSSVGESEHGFFAKLCRMNGYLAIIVGMGLTISVQSSSIITSAFTPLVGIGTLPLENMLAFSVGANIGTTCTGLLAALVSGTSSALQIALCHLLFNVFGTLIWYPAPVMRNMPLKAARAQGYLTICFSWWPFIYVFAAFFLLPLSLLGVSTLIDIGGVGGGFGWFIFVCIVLTVLAFIFWYNFKGGKEMIVKILEPHYERGSALLQAKMNKQKQIEMVDVAGGSDSNNPNVSSLEDVVPLDGKQPEKIPQEDQPVAVASSVVEDPEAETADAEAQKEGEEVAVVIHDDDDMAQEESPVVEETAAITVGVI